MEPLNEDNWDVYSGDDHSESETYHDDTYPFDLQDDYFGSSSSGHAYSDGDSFYGEYEAPPRLELLDSPGEVVYHSQLRKNLLKGDETVQRIALPPDVVDLILDMAQYWAVSGAVCRSAVRGENLTERHVTAWLPRNARSCKKLIFKALAHDQGWATSSDPGSYTWGEFSRVRLVDAELPNGSSGTTQEQSGTTQEQSAEHQPTSPSDYDCDKECEPNALTSSERRWFKKVSRAEYQNSIVDELQSQHLTTTTHSECLQSKGYRLAMPADCQAHLSAVKPTLNTWDIVMLGEGYSIAGAGYDYAMERIGKTKSGSLGHVMLVDKVQEVAAQEEDRTVAYTNPRANLEWTTHVAELDAGHKLLQALRPGEGIAFLVRSQYPGWMHFLAGASIQLQYTADSTNDYMHSDGLCWNS